MMKAAFQFVCLISVLVTLGFSVQAEPLAIDLAEDEVNITTGFTGSSLIVFGTKSQKGEVAIVVEGPEYTDIVRRKERMLGAWMNSKTLKFKNVPSYYDYALSTEKVDGLLPPEILKNKRIGLEAIKTAPASSRHAEGTVKIFQDAMIRNNQNAGFYPKKPKEIVFLDDNFFRVNFKLPSNVPIGHYTVKAFLIRDGKILHKWSEGMDVEQVGLSSNVYIFAHQHSIVYAFICILIACMAGWLSNALVRRS